MNHVCLIGRLGVDPQIRYSNEGKTIASFSVAINEAYTDSRGEKQTHVNWVRCTAFNRTADIAAEYLHKGMRVGIAGSLRQRSFEGADGERRSVVEIAVRSIDFLSNGKGNGGDHENGGPPEEDEIPF